MPHKFLKKAASKIKYKLKGGKYGEIQEERARRTPEGRKMMESIKKEGFWPTLRKSRRGGFNE